MMGRFVTVFLPLLLLQLMKHVSERTKDISAFDPSTTMTVSPHITKYNSTFDRAYALPAYKGCLAPNLQDYARQYHHRMAAADAVTRSRPPHSA